MTTCIKVTKYTTLLFFIFALSLVFTTNLYAKVKVGETAAVNISSPSELRGEWAYAVTKSGATFIKLHFKELVLSGGDKVELMDKNGASIISYSESRNDFWAPAVDGDIVTVILASAGSSSRFVIDSYGYGDTAGESATAEVTCGGDDKTDRECHGATYRYNAAKSVGRMLFQEYAGGGWYLCTGSLISPNGHFLTNNHCISTQYSAGTLDVRFNYEYSTCGGAILKPFDTYNGSVLLLTNAGLDFTLLTVNGNPATIYGYLPLSGRALTQGDLIYIPQHPGGDPKKIAATREGTIWCDVPQPMVSEGGYDANSSFMHRCDTIGGSSGSPVLDTQNHVIGLHHTGYNLCPGSSVQGYNGAILMSRILPLIAGNLPQDILDANEGSCSGCSGWVWGMVNEAWRYTSGAQERMWLYFTTSAPSYVWIDHKAEPVLSKMATEAAESYHWFGTYWTSGTRWTNARLWYY